MKISIINGLNLNLLGVREPEIYGNLSFDVCLDGQKSRRPDVEFSFFQSNVEGELINEIQKRDFSADGIILNPGGYAHTSVAIADTVAAVSASVVEVHLSNIYARKEFRHVSVTSRKFRGLVTGFGLDV